MAKTIHTFTFITSENGFSYGQPCHIGFIWCIGRKPTMPYKPVPMFKLQSNKHQHIIKLEIQMLQLTANHVN